MSQIPWASPTLVRGANFSKSLYYKNMRQNGNNLKSKELEEQFGTVEDFCSAHFCSALPTK
jgi:hypothetical protein